MKNIKSLQLGMHWFPERSGGLDRVYYSLNRSLPKAGVEIRGLVTGKGQAEIDTNGQVKSFARADDSLIQRVIASRRAIKSELASFRPDSVAIHFALYAFAATRALLDVPTIMHFHGPWAYESAVEDRKRLSRTLKASLERHLYLNTTRQIVLSKAFAKILEERYGVSQETIDIVPGAVDVSGFETSVSRQGARELLGLPNDRPIVVAVRRLVKRMGLEDLIDAIALLREKWPDLLLVIAGRGAQSGALAARAEAAGISESVKFLGYVSDENLPLLYKSADLSVVPTVALEGFGLITVESLASGTPVLVTPVGGLPEVVAGLSADMILEATGSLAIADGIQRFLSGATRLPDSYACNSYARENFDLPVMAKRTAEVYRKAAS